MCRLRRYLTRKVDGMIKYFVDPFGPIFNYPPKKLSITESLPTKKGSDKEGVKIKPASSRQPLTSVEPESGSTLEVCPAVKILDEKKIKAVPTPLKAPEKIKTAPGGQAEKIKASVVIEEAPRGSKVDAAKRPSLEKTITDKEKDKIKMSYHKDKKEKCHDDHHHYRCCEAPELPVVGKIFEWCDYKHYYDDIEKFIEYIKEYYCKYPCILVKWEIVYPSKCKLRICVWFNICEYDKAFEIELALQKKYRKLKMHHHHHHHDHPHYKDD